MTKDRLQAQTRKQLAALARKRGVAGWHDMTKEQLVRALMRGDRASRRSAVRPRRSGTTSRSRRPAVARRSSSDDPDSPELQAERSKYDVGVATRDLTTRLPRDLPNGYGKDRIVVMVRDPYWLHCYWEVTSTAVQRAEAALGQDWHGSRPILRLFDVGRDETTSASEAPVRDIDIHGGCNNWYIEVQNPPRSYRVDIGYLTKGGRFYVVARSNVVSTPRPGISDAIDENWTDVQQNYEKIYAMSGGYHPGASSLELKQLFEERLRRPMGSPAVTSFGSGAMGHRQRKFFFELDAELIVYGATEPNAKVTLQGEPVSIRPDGTFTVRFSLPDGRQIIPAVSVSADGVEERTIVLAVERNTKALEPLIHDGSEPA